MKNFIIDFTIGSVCFAAGFLFAALSLSASIKDLKWREKMAEDIKYKIWEDSLKEREKIKNKNKNV